MQTKQVISEIDFDNSIAKLNRLELADDIQYIKDELGIRALGAIYVGGNYDDEEGNRDFEEYIELDVLAPYDKLHDFDEFKVKLSGYDYSVINSNLKLVIDLDIYGIYEDNNDEDLNNQESYEADFDMPLQFVEKTLNDSDDAQPEVLEEPYVIPCECNAKAIEEYEIKHRECLEKHKDIIHPDAYSHIDSPSCPLNIDDKNEEVIEETEVQSSFINKNSSNLNIDKDEDIFEEFEESIIFDDILDDQICTMDTMKYYVCDSDSSYEQISKKYNVDLKKLMKANNYKVIGDKSIVEIPND